MSQPNPNKANQWRPDPRQAEFIINYLDKKSETYANAYRSAIKAGYSDDLKEFLQDDEKKYRWKSTEFTLKTLFKEKYSERKELTGKDGQPILVELSPEIAEKYEITSNTKPDSEGQT